MKTPESATIIPFDARHERCAQLLPWWVNGTLSAEERQLVRGHLGQCSACRQDVAQLELLARHIRAPAVDTRCEDALRRLHAKIELPRRARRPLPWAAAAVLVLVFGLTNATSRHAEANTSWLRNMGLSKMQQAPVLGNDARPLMARLVFYNDITEGQLRALLLSVGAELVEGPTDRGVYTISINPGRQWPAATQALARLRHSGQVVYAEPTLPNAISDIGGW